MTSDMGKKKQPSVRELAAGSTILVLGLPIVIGAFLLSFMAVAVSLLGLLFGQAMPSVWLVLALVYGACLALLIALAWRFGRRSLVLTERIFGMWRERRRTAPLVTGAGEPDTSRIQLETPTELSVQSTDLAADDIQHLTK